MGESIGVELLICGHTRQWGRFARVGRGMVNFPATVALLRHRDQIVLFDTGYSARSRELLGRWPEAAYQRLLPIHLQPGEAIGAQLRHREIDPSSVETVIISHFHADHIGGLGELPDARIIHGTDQTPVPGFRPGRRATLAQTCHSHFPQLLPVDLDSRAIACTDLERVPASELGVLGELFGGGWDVFGDRSAIIIPLPGHDDGHIGLWLPIPTGAEGRPTAPMLLVGDASWAPIPGGRPPVPPVSHLMRERSRYLDTWHKLDEFARRRPSATIIPSHAGESVMRASKALRWS
ncbi:hypothetical protein HMPREF1531_00016 [Propionibacterium sp. oral taxon 192 str. F0372]|uniref:MBL fold metallo-hydrolase n=1 Tax=Propionibacterium sp. oral taxon 192 TaxID=671222 RepID=UPI00035275C7|nr:MBL fold metallo-hydrolase [Propionibacterium sp. oral taxon 192]EPH06972.1 hypothetical protein HMPREF1531_00016 [Propionibacterium sp. oral taxon 192 str. F0372]